MKHGGFEPKTWDTANSVARKHLGGAAAASQENTPWDATTLQQEGTWGRRQHRRKGLGDATTLPQEEPLGAAATPLETSRERGLGHPVTNEHPSRTEAKAMAPNRARIWRANEKEPDLLQFSPCSRNRAKVSTALSRHYTEGSDGYTRRVLLKLQQIAIRCIRQRDPAARQSETSTRQHGAGVRQRAAGRLPA